MDHNIPVTVTNLKDGESASDAPRSKDYDLDFPFSIGTNAERTERLAHRVAQLTGASRQFQSDPKLLDCLNELSALKVEVSGMLSADDPAAPQLDSLKGPKP